MRRANVALVLIGTFFSVMVSLGVMVSPSKTAFERTATNVGAGEARVGGTESSGVTLSRGGSRGHLTF
jgi:hypothetical protein